MKRTRTIILYLFISIMLLIPACSFPERHLPGVYVWVTRPSAGHVLELGPIIVVAGGFLEDTSPVPSDGLGTFSFYANARKFAEMPSDGSSSDVIRVTWEPTEPGEYFLQASVEIGVQVATSEAVRVCVIEPPTVGDSVGDSYSGVYGYFGPCDLSGLRSEFGEPGPISMSAYADPDNLYYNLEGASDCPLVEIDFWAIVTDPPNDIAVVMVEYSMPSVETGGGVGSVHLAQTSWEDISYPDKSYEGSTGDLDTFIFNEGVTGASEIEWTARAFGHDWGLLLTDGPYTIPVFPCTVPPGTPVALEVTPIPTEASQRCEIFNGIQIEPVVLPWTAGSPLTFYLKIPGGVPGLENEVLGDSDPWNYSVDWGGYISERCEFIPGYDERLYCTIEFPAEYANSNQAMELHVNRCDKTIYANPRAEVPAFGSGPIKPDEGSGSESGGCQPPPAGCGPNSSWFAEPYCMCSPY